MPRRIYNWHGHVLMAMARKNGRGGGKGVECVKDFGGEMCVGVFEWRKPNLNREISFCFFFPSPVFFSVVAAPNPTHNPIFTAQIEISHNYTQSFFTCNISLK